MKAIYQFQQAEWGDLWAIPIEPVHPDTRGMFCHPNKLGGWSATPSDTCWCGLPLDSDFANRYWMYRDGETGLCYRVHVNDVLDDAVGEGNLALMPVPVPVGDPLPIDDDAQELWGFELHEANREPEEFNLGQRVAGMIRAGHHVNGITADQLIDCSDGSGANCIMDMPTPLADSWNNDRERCTPPPPGS